MILCIKIKGGRASTTCLDDVRQHLKDNLAHYVLPDNVVSIENMPITKHGKWHKKLYLEYVCCEYYFCRHRICLDNCKVAML